MPAPPYGRMADVPDHARDRRPRPDLDQSGKVPRAAGSLRPTFHRWIGLLARLPDCGSALSGKSHFQQQATIERLVSFPEAVAVLRCAGCDRDQPETGCGNLLPNHAAQNGAGQYRSRCRMIYLAWRGRCPLVIVVPLLLLLLVRLLVLDCLNLLAESNSRTSRRTSGSINQTKPSR